MYPVYYLSITQARYVYYRALRFKEADAPNLDAYIEKYRGYGAVECCLDSGAKMVINANVITIHGYCSDGSDVHASLEVAFLRVKKKGGD